MPDWGQAEQDYAERPRKRGTDDLRPGIGRFATVETVSHDAEIPVPSAQAVAKSLARLAALRVEDPLAPELVADDYNLLLTPFARLIEPFAQRALRVRAAVEHAIQSLSDERRRFTAHYMLLTSNKGRTLNARRQATYTKIGHLVRGDDANKVVGRLEKPALLQLATILVSDDFASEFAEHESLSPRSALPPVRQPGLVYVRQCWAIEYDDHDPTKQTSYRAVRVRALVGGQRTFEIPYYGYAEPAAVEVLTADRAHSYLGSRSDREAGKPEGWSMHFFHLGRVMQAGETATIAWQEQIVYKEPEADVYLSFNVVHQEAEQVSVAIKLPVAFRDRAGKARTIANVFGQPEILRQHEIRPNQDGWVIAHFDNLRPGLQYGVFFPGLDFHDTL